MAQKQINLIPTGDLTSTPFSYKIEFDGRRRNDAGVRYQFGTDVFNGPVALKIAENDSPAATRLHRESDVSEFLRNRGGELISKCIARDFGGPEAHILVSHRGRPLADLVTDRAKWPPADGIRRKMITDLLQALDLLRLSGLVHGGIDIRNLHWDGGTLQLTDFGGAALRGTYPDGSAAHHGDDVLAAGRVIYHLVSGAPPPGDPATLRADIEDVQDAGLATLLLHRDLVTRTDVDYVFAFAPADRPTARVLLDRLDRAPHGVRWEQLAAREAALRADFRRLRAEQRRYRDARQAWERDRAAPPQPRRAPVTWTVPEPRRPVPETGRVRHEPLSVSTEQAGGGPAQPVKPHVETARPLVPVLLAVAMGVVFTVLLAIGWWIA